MALTPEDLKQITDEVARQQGAGARIAPQVATPSAPASSPAGLGDMSAVIAAAAAAGAQAAIAALGHGGASAPAAPAQRAPAYTRPLGPPASDGGGPAAPARNLDGVSLVSMSEADRAHLIRVRGLDWYKRTLMEQSKSMTVKLR